MNKINKYIYIYILPPRMENQMDKNTEDEMQVLPTAVADAFDSL